ncbi:hypothetical protein ACIA5C_12195 [Actinoplanes sp. NPDC051343]|uniref:hypothetical protein n=1 Tax=Actinoplanes sp. NPDC051343 TaxID=3363906 RepID=UPI003798D35F
MQPLPYAEVTDDAYAQEAAATLTAREFGSAVVLSGGCPRCHDPFSFTLVTEVFRDDPATPAPTYRTIFCTCVADHPPRAEGQAGCGAYWTVELDTEP